jgi:deazaflavin-dependent oxidoreductase (nitroreductase family)
MQIALTTTGRKSGRPHPVTLYAFEDQGRLIVVGSYGGAANDPDWVVNLRAHPRVQVRRDGRQDEMKAEEVTGPDRERVWQLVTAAFPMYQSYQRQTKRTIPLFALKPVEAG